MAELALSEPSSPVPDLAGPKIYTGARPGTTNHMPDTAPQALAPISIRRLRPKYFDYPQLMPNSESAHSASGKSTKP
jgi:hypothetical protein